MAVEQFQTRVRAEVYTKTGLQTNKYMDAGTVVWCEFEWGTGSLSGKRKIVTCDRYPLYVGFFVRSVDLTAYTLPPPADDIMVHYVNGVETERFKKVAG